MTDQTTVRQALLHGLPFWAEALAGQQCIVPCWPTDEDKGGFDCEDNAALVGAMGEDGIFRSESFMAFRPAVFGWVCGRHGGPGLTGTDNGVDGHGWLPSHGQPTI